MIDPLLSPELGEFARQLRSFAADRLAPHYQANDRAGALAPNVRRDLAELGLLGLRIPENHGGQGADAVTAGVACEAVGRGDFNAGYLLVNTALVGEILRGAATEEQQARFLPSIASGEVVPAICLTEPEHGSDAAAIEMRAEPDGDGYRLFGEKTSITFGMQAETALVLARTSADGARGITAFYVTLREGVIRSPFDDLGNRAIGRATLHFDAFRVDRKEIIGPVGGGFSQVMQGFEYSRALIGLVCLGAADIALEEALQYARDREAFGQPIGRFQGVSFPLVEHATFVAAARLLCFRALELKDRGLPHAVEANMVKWWAPRLSFHAAHDALLTFGHAGYSEDLPAGQRLRDIVGMEIGDGTAQISKLVVARELLGRDHAP